MQHIPNVSSSNPGKKIDFVAHPEAVLQFRDQLTPYQGAFGCNPLGMHVPGKEVPAPGGTSPWPATLFRFPLRSQAQAAASNISKQVRTYDPVTHMIPSHI